jgi:recombination protein RecT
MTDAKTNGAQQLLKHELERIRPALMAVLPKHVTADRILKVLLSATARQPKLLECTTPSIVRAVMQAGELGLELGGLLGEAYLVPFRNKQGQREAQCIPGYKGLIKLARQSGQIAGISARIVYSGDAFSVDLAEETIHHEPDFEGDRESAAIMAAYAIARFVDGGRQVEVMTRAESESAARRATTGHG